MDLPERVAVLRKQGGVSASELSSLAGLSPAHVALIERGSRPNITVTTAMAIARVFGVSVEYLVAGEGPAPSPDDVVAAIARARETRPVGADHTASDFTPDNAVGPEAA